MSPNFALLDLSQPEVAILVGAMVQARDAVERRSWSHPQEPTNEEWWADVLADPRARRREHRASDLPLRRAFYRLADEPREIILVACSKCDWKAAFRRADLVASHGADYAMPTLLKDLAAPDCSKTDDQWDRCGVYYVEPIEARPGCKSHPLEDSLPALWQTERAVDRLWRGRSDMRRREFITLLGGSAASWPLAARAQQAGKVHRIGFLGSSTAAGSAKPVKSLRTGLREFGYVEGTNIVIEFRWAEGNYERLPHLVAELIATNVDVLITHGTPGTRVAKEVTTSIPIVMAISGEAIATGLVSSLAKPDANLTGSTFFLPQLNAKRLEVLKEACPRISRPAALSNPDNPVSRPIIPAMQAAAASLSLIVEVVRTQSPSEFSLAFAALAKSRVDSVVVTEDGEFAASFRTIATLALANKLPSIGAREYAEAGGLIGYGVDILGLYRRAAYFVDRIFKGAKPADLPIEQPTRFELIVNLKTAKALGLEIPPSFLVRADEVIE